MSTTPSRYQQVMADPRTPMCKTPGCDRKAWAKGLCGVCYKMTRNYGVAKTGWHDPEQIRQRRIKFLWDNIDVRGPGECWPWKRKLKSTGYGQLRWFDRPIGPHVAVFELAYGPTPPETPFHDHVCHDPKVCDLLDKCPHRSCCNPAHIKAVTRAENQSKNRSRSKRPDNGGGKKCEPGCTCNRHRGEQCPPGCTCKRHSRGPCEPGCTCHRHEGRKCAPGCTCGLHDRPRPECCPECGTPYSVRNSGARICVPCRNASQREYRLRTGRSGGGGTGARERAKTHCPQNHEYTEENTYINPRGHRACRECSRDSKRRMRLNSPGGGRTCPPGCTCGRHRSRR